MKKPVIISQPKYDGMRMIWHRRGDKIAAYTEDAKRDRAFMFPQIVKEIKDNIKGDFIIDTEMVEWDNNAPIPRESMMWMVVSKTPMKDKQEVHVNVHDILYYDDKAINLEPYTTRLEYLDKILPKDLKYLKKAKSCVITDRKSFNKCLKQSYEYPGSEGTVAKYGSSVYDPSRPRTSDWVKIKRVKELDVQIIGIQKKALPFISIKMRTPTKTITGKEALDLYKRLTKKSNTYLFRCAILDGKDLKPIDSKKRFTDSDFEVRWNADLTKPKWQGLDDPNLWSMNKDFKRGPGDLAFGNTYAFKVVPEPKLGDIITVAPVQIVEFKDKDDTGLAWMFPRVRERKPDKDKPDQLKDIKHLIRKE